MPVSGLSVMATEGLGCAARAMALCDSNGMSRKTGGSEKSEVRVARVQKGERLENSTRAGGWVSMRSPCRIHGDELALLFFFL